MTEPEANNLDNPVWLNILFWIVTPIMLIGVLITCMFLTGSGTALINGFIRRSPFGIIAKVLSWLSVFYFPAVVLLMFISLYMRRSIYLFSF